MTDFSVCKLVIGMPEIPFIEGVVYGEETSMALTFYMASYRGRTEIRSTPCAPSPGRIHWWRFRMERAARAHQEDNRPAEVLCEERVTLERALDFIFDGMAATGPQMEAMRASFGNKLSACAHGSPAMGAPARRTALPGPIRINIVEEEGWSRWDPAGDISEWASDNAWDDWRHMEESRCQELVDDLVGASMGKREREKIGSEELERICAQLKDEWLELESTHQAIMDALQWAWEVAYTPDDGDIGSAMEKAGDRWDPDFGKHWDLISGEIRIPPKGAKGPKEWIPQTAEWDMGGIVAELLKHVTYSRKPGWYDRYVTFDFGKAEPVKDLLKASEDEKRRLEAEIRKLDAELPGLPETPQGHDRRAEIEDAIQEHQEEIDGLGEIPDLLRQEFEEWSDSHRHTFFKALDDVMQDADPSNKFELREHWKSVLGDKQRMKGVREELLEFLKKPAPERGEE